MAMSLFLPFNNQGGFVRYIKSPDSQIINTPLEFSVALAGSIHDIGMTWSSGGSYAQLKQTGKTFWFRPLFQGNPQLAGSNGLDFEYLLVGLVLLK